MADLLKINNGGIDFKKIESKIEKNIKKRKKESEKYNKNVLDFKIKEIKLLTDPTEYYDIRALREISSHRPIIGSVLIKIRQILDDEIKRSIDPIIYRQIKFNKGVIDRINELTEENKIEKKKVEMLERLNVENKTLIKKLVKLIKKI